MMTLFGEVEHALDRTWDIAQRCQLKLEPVEEPFPKFGVPPKAHSTDTLLRIRRAAGIREAPRATGSAGRARAASSTISRSTPSAWIAKSRRSSR